MTGYYYLGAQLPLLFFDREPLISIEVFVAEAAKWLRAADLTALDLVSLEPVDPAPGLPGVLRRFIDFERNLRTDIEAYRRGLRSGQEYKPLHFPLAVVKDGNPLDVERKLLRLRWDFLSELEIGHYFDIDFILIYRLKLQILGRLLLFDREKGARVFQQLCEVSI